MALHMARPPEITLQVHAKAGMCKDQAQQNMCFNPMNTTPVGLLDVLLAFVDNEDRNSFTG
jgi:hypothetical protein